MINKGKVLSLKKIKNVNFFSKNKFILLMCILFMLGVITSVIFHGKRAVSFNWSEILRLSFIRRKELSFIKIFLLSFLNCISVLAVLYVAGTSVMGIGIVPCVVFLLGILSGGISSYLYSVYSLKGVAFNALIVLPASVIFFTECFFAAKTSVEFSLDLSRVTLKKISGSVPIDFKSYCRSYIIFVLCSIGVSLFDALLSAVFIKIFKF